MLKLVMYIYIYIYIHIYLRYFILLSGQALNGVDARREAGRLLIIIVVLIQIMNISNTTYTYVYMYIYIYIYIYTYVPHESFWDALGPRPWASPRSGCGSTSRCPSCSYAVRDVAGMHACMHACTCIHTYVRTSVQVRTYAYDHDQTFNSSEHVCLYLTRQVYTTVLARQPTRHRNPRVKLFRRPLDILLKHVYMCICIHNSSLSLSLYIYIYIYIERERERETYKYYHHYAWSLILLLSLSLSLFVLLVLFYIRKVKHIMWCDGCQSFV